MSLRDHKIEVNDESFVQKIELRNLKKNVEYRENIKHIIYSFKLYIDGKFVKKMWCPGNNIKEVKKDVATEIYYHIKTINSHL